MEYRGAPLAYRLRYLAESECGEPRDQLRIVRIVVAGQLGSMI